MARKGNFVGKYRLLEELANGAFGRVYRAEDTSMKNRVVAIKLLHGSLLPSAQERAKFLREAQFLTLLKHPFILPVLDVGIADDTPFLVTEYAPYGSLDDRIKKQGPLPFPVHEALPILGQVGDALQCAHNLSIIHRDLKPANILFNARGEALLADFGIATTVASSNEYGTIIGTPLYMAPEQFRGAISKEGDQYSLGCIAYQLLTGQAPFMAPDFFTMGYKHMSEQPMPPSQLNLLVPRSTEQAVLKAMAKQRSDRYRDVRSFLIDAGIPASLLISSAPITGQSLAQHIPSTQTPDHRRKVQEREGGFEVAFQRPELAAETTGAALGEESWRPRPSGLEEVTGDIGSFFNVPPGKPESKPRVEAEGRPASPAFGPTAFQTKDAPGFETLPLLKETSGIAGPSELENAATVTGFPAAPLEYEPTWQLSPHQSASGGSNPYTPTPQSIEQSPTGFFGAPLPPPPHNIDHIPVGFFDAPLPLPPRPAPSGQRAKQNRKRRTLFLIGSILLALLLVSGGIMYAFGHLQGNKVVGPGPATPGATSTSPAITTGARVTITPVRKSLSTTFTIDAVFGNPDASKQQVSARSLSSTTSAQSQTIPATGQNNTPPTSARGTLTLLNDSFNPVTYGAGTTLTSDSNHIQVVLDGTITVSAGNPSGPSWGAATVSASAAISGPSGNFGYGAFDTRIFLGNQNGYDTYMHVYNSSAFSGGSNGQTYTYVTASNFYAAQAAAQRIEATETSNAQANVSSQVGSDQLLGSVRCSPQAQYNHAIGDQATSITATAQVTCSAQVYDAQGALALASQLLKNKIIAPYIQSGDVTSSILQVSGAGPVVLQVKAQGAELYQFSAAQQQQIAGEIAGDSQQAAQSLLMNTPGVSQVTIILAGAGNILPSDQSKIQIVTVGN